MSDQPAINVHRHSVFVTTTQEQLDDVPRFNLIEWMEREEARWAALTPEQRAAEKAEREARQAAEKAARSCEHCGCDPDEHGGY